MPNATLCGKAVALMVLSQLSSGTPLHATEAEAALNDITTTLIDNGDLPPQYLLTPERIQRTLQMPTVAMREAEAMRPLAEGKGEEKRADEYCFVRRSDRNTQELAGEESGRCCVM